MRVFTGLAVCAVFMLFSGTASAQVFPTPDDCVSSKCHAEMGKAEYVHGPVGAMICSVCHDEKGDKHKDNKIDLAVAEQDMCYYCHEEKQTQFMLPVQHKPVAQGQCVGCHDPHQSNFKFQLKGQADSLCYLCHPNNVRDKQLVHGPVATGNCQLCHEPHASSYPRLLRSEGNQVCLDCHQEKVRDMTMRHVHPPVAEGCTECHMPHASDAKMLLTDDPPTLCFGCHPGIQEFVADSVNHPPTEEGKCLTCHAAHASEQPKVLVEPLTELCFSCHEREGNEVLTDANRHGPVRQGDCSACHNPHGQINPYLLKKFFPEEFYNSYSTDEYALCFDCHNKDIALDARTRTLTDFRDGDENLHYLHVNKETKGRSCKACHGVHSSNQAKHIRTAVPFGKAWSYPIKYTKNADGGSCVVGCHKPQEYTRGK